MESQPDHGIMFVAVSRLQATKQETEGAWMNHQSQLDKPIALWVPLSLCALSDTHTKGSILLRRPHVPFIEYGLGNHLQICHLTTGAPCGLAARCRVLSPPLILPPRRSTSSGRGPQAHSIW
jgi:hypothetical protein